MQKIGRLVQKLLDSAPGRLALEYGESGAPNYAAGVAFNAFFTMFPLILGLLAILGLVVRNEAFEVQVRQTLVNIFPVEDHQSLELALRGLKNNAGYFALLSIAGLLYSGTNFFSSLEFALNQIFKCRGRDPIRTRVMGLLMLLIFVITIIVAVAANAAIALLPAVPFLGALVGTVVLVMLTAAIYAVVPNHRTTVGEILPGSVFAGIAIEILTLAFPLYAQVTHSFGTYGRGFALMFLLATWLYFLCQVLMIGAVLNRMLLGRVPEVKDVPSIARTQDADACGVEAEPAGVLNSKT